MSKFKIGDLVVIIRSKQTKICYEYNDVFNEELKVNLDGLYGKIGTITGFGFSEIITNECYFVKLNEENITIRVYESNLKITSYSTIKQIIASLEHYWDDWDKLLEDQKTNAGYIDKECKERWNEHMNKHIVSMWLEESSNNLKKVYDKVILDLNKNDTFALLVLKSLNKITKGSEELGIYIGEKPNFKLSINHVDANDYLTESTKYKKDQISILYEKELAKINGLANEANAMIKDCETYEQSMSVLEAYGIVKQNKLNSRTYDELFFHISE